MDGNTCSIIGCWSESAVLAGLVGVMNGQSDMTARQADCMVG